jgi:hypothetical protein
MPSQWMTCSEAFVSQSFTLEPWTTRTDTYSLPVFWSICGIGSHRHYRCLHPDPNAGVAEQRLGPVHHRIPLGRPAQYDGNEEEQRVFAQAEAGRAWPTVWMGIAAVCADGVETYLFKQTLHWNSCTLSRHGNGGSRLFFYCPRGGAPGGAAVGAHPPTKPPPPPGSSFWPIWAKHVPGHPSTPRPGGGGRTFLKKKQPDGQHS